MSVVVSGDAVGGWIVEIHDGDRFGSFPMHAADAAAAEAEGQRLFAAAAPVVPAAATDAEIAELRAENARLVERLGAVTAAVDQH